MRWNIRTWLLLTLTSTGLAFWLGSVRAAGVPQHGGLVYAGVIQEGTELPTGQRAIRLDLYDASTAGTQLCHVDPGMVEVTNGRFRIDLGAVPPCLAAVRENQDVWVEVRVGIETLGRSKIGAVPYAIEAARASDSAGALGTLLTALGARLTALESQTVVVDVSSDVAQTGAHGADLVYTGLDANLTPGTWLVQGFATLTSLGNTDAQQLVLYNETTGTEVPNSKGAVQSTTVDIAYGALEATAVMVVTAPTVVRLKGLRNGSSTLRFGDPNSALILSGKQRILAVKLR